MEATPGGHRTTAAVLARVVPPSERRGALLCRADRLTPYAAETIADDARRAGPGARLEITLAPCAADAELAAVRETFACLVAHGVEVRIRRQREVGVERAGVGLAAGVLVT